MIMTCAKSGIADKIHSRQQRTTLTEASPPASDGTLSLRAATRTWRLHVGVSRGRIGGLLFGCDSGRIVIAAIAIISIRRSPTSIMPVLVLGSAAEVASTYPAQVVSTHRAAEMTFAHRPKMTPAHPAAEVATNAATTTSKRVGRNANAAAMAATMIAILCNTNLHSLELAKRVTDAARVAGAPPPCSTSAI
jgi:hypothetical protein